MADQKLSGLPTDSSLTSTHSVPVTNPTGPTTKKTLLSTLAAWLFNQTNLPAGATGSPLTRAADNITNYVVSGMVWSADAVGSTRNASMTAGVQYINGRRISIGAVTARSFTASKDTYIDVLDNGDGTGTLVYTEVTNNAASPALAANSIRIGIIVTGATTIATAGSVNQGDPLAVLPIVSSVAYSVTDSLGNLICNRSSNPTLIGYRKLGSTFNSGYTAGVYVDIPALSAVPAIIPQGRHVEVEAYSPGTDSNQAVSLINFGVREGSTVMAVTDHQLYNANIRNTLISKNTIMPSAGLHTYKGSFAINQTGGSNFYASSASNEYGYVSIKLT